MPTSVIRKRFRSDKPTSSSWVRENFIVGNVLGSGTFGNVYQITCRRKPSVSYAMKELARGNLPKYIATELRILQQFGGVHNIMRMHAAHRDKDRVFIVMDYFEHTPTREFIASITTLEILDYMKNLLDALRYLHGKGIIHRDVKPSNFLYNHKTHKYCLIDFGLCEEIPKGQSPFKLVRNYRSMRKKNAAKSLRVREQNEMVYDFDDDETRGIVCDCYGKPCVCTVCLKRPRPNVNKAGTPGFRAPEVLLKNKEQTSLIDIWSAGITFLTLVCRKYPVMRPYDDCEAIAQMSVIFGTAKMEHLARKTKSLLLWSLNYPGVDMVKFVNAVRNEEFPERNDTYCETCRTLFFGNYNARCLCHTSEQHSLRRLAPDERQVFEVLKRCLIIDPDKRYTAEMLSAFFC